METSVLDMPLHAAMTVMKEWVADVHDGKLELTDSLKCPVQQWIMQNNKACGRDMSAGIATCPICGEYMCKDCLNHKCTPLSRVTGYVAPVKGWNASKRQELRDRVKTQI